MNDVSIITIKAEQAQYLDGMMPEQVRLMLEKGMAITALAAVVKKQLTPR